MTVTEMSHLFDTLYDNANQEAPGLNSFEKSQYLTKALYSITRKTVEDYLVNGKSTGQSIDELSRFALKGLVTSYIKDTPIATTTIPDRTTPNSEFFELPPDLFYILYEDVELDGVSVYNYGPSIIKPARYDTINSILRNPYRKPSESKRIAYRLEKADTNGNALSEIIVVDGRKPVNYRIRYVRQPYPIILEDLTVAYPGLNLSIHGETAPYVDITGEDQATNASPLSHEQIVQRAVELAIRHYRENTLTNNVQTENI